VSELCYVDYLCGYLVLFVGSWAAACVMSLICMTDYWSSLYSYSFDPLHRKHHSKNCCCCIMVDMGACFGCHGNMFTSLSLAMDVFSWPAIQFSAMSQYWFSVYENQTGPTTFCTADFICIHPAAETCKWTYRYIISYIYPFLHIMQKTHKNHQIKITRFYKKWKLDVESISNMTPLCHSLWQS
jgi:hypothetical protein